MRVSAIPCHMLRSWLSQNFLGSTLWNIVPKGSGMRCTQDAQGDHTGCLGLNTGSCVESLRPTCWTAAPTPYFVLGPYGSGILASASGGALEDLSSSPNFPSELFFGEVLDTIWRGGWTKVVSKNQLIPHSEETLKLRDSFPLCLRHGGASLRFSWQKAEPQSLM